MIVTAIMMVRNEQNILPISVGYLLNEVGVDRLIIADNGSTDLTLKILSRLSQMDARVRWTDVSGPYHQAEIVTELAREECRNGAHWIIPNDADEFFWIKGQRLRDVLSSTDAGILLFGVCQFVQWSRVQRDHLGAAEKMVFSVEPIGDVENGRRRVEESEISYLQARSEPKLILRSSSSLIIHKGNHQAEGFEGRKLRLPGTDVLHAGLRARDHLCARVVSGKRVQEVGVSGDTSWHLRRLVKVEQSGRMDEEWRANSVRFGRIGPAQRKKWLRLDLRLRRIARQQRAFGARCISTEQ